MVAPIIGTARALYNMPKAGVEELDQQRIDIFKQAIPELKTLEERVDELTKLAARGQDGADTQEALRTASQQLLDTVEPIKTALGRQERSVAFGALGRDLGILAGIGAALLAASFAGLLPVDLGKAGDVVTKLSTMPARIGTGAGALVLTVGAGIAARASKVNAKQSLEGDVLDFL